MKSLISLFLSQSYFDAWDDYERSLKREKFVKWDYVILTASNEQQAAGFRAQLRERQQVGFLPEKTHFAVLPDPDGKRVGSGGATLNVIRYIAQKEKTTDFSNKRILVIHSGGDSKRVPQYSALGKLFSPVPHKLPNGRMSTLFDEFMIGTSGVPSRIREGMVLLSGDVLLLFNSLQIDFSGAGAAAISFKEDVETGKNHGVFLKGKDGNVEEFLHKQTVETLQKKGAVNERGCVDIDTGAVIFSSEMLSALCGLISENGVCTETRFDSFVNEKVRLSLYGDFLYPLASASTLEAFYQEKPEGEFCDELTLARTAVWNALRPFRMKLLRLSPAKFVHFGTTREIMKLMSQDIGDYQYLKWARQVGSSVEYNQIAAYNSILSRKASCGKNSYLEASYVHSSGIIGENVILSYIDIHDETIPDNVVLHGLKQKDGRFVARIYGIDDNPKDELEKNCSFLGSTLEAFLRKNKIQPEELWDGASHSLWLAKLYPACTNIKDAVGEALNLYEMVNGRGDVERWRHAVRQSLCAGFHDADADALIAWDKRMQELVRMENLAKLIANKDPIDSAADILNHEDHLTKIQCNWLERHAKNAANAEAIRLYYYTGKAIGGMEGELYIDKCFARIRQDILTNTLKSLTVNTTCRISKEEHIVKLPLRVNWGGGWSDTPPYCNENGGTVLNAAITLNGELPVEVTLRRLEEKKIVFDSRDMDSHGEFTDIKELQDCGNPYDSFALQKAALIACGVIPGSGSSLDEVLTRLGGGIFMSTEVTGVPKGSGLGTSSILAGACVKGLFEFLDIKYTDNDLYDHVLCMEQIMSTGGGWQDQIGGLSNGIKYIISRTGMHQKMKVTHVELNKDILAELNERYALIYTGQRRLARNLLRDVVGRYIGNVPEAKQALTKIQKVAVLMRFELERGNIDEFAKLLSVHWELSKMLDIGSTNTCIEQIFLSIEDLIDGKMICGAGGGGFLQVILKKGVTKAELRMRLHEVFQDSGVDVWDCCLI